MNVSDRHIVRGFPVLSRSLWAATLLVLSLAAPALAEDRAGSLLVFPEFDNRAGFVTVVSLTNTSPTESVRVMFQYFNEGTCNEFNRSHLLTPFDTLTLVTNVHNPNLARGYLVVFALDLQFQPAPFNHLIGTSRRVSSLDQASYMIEPFAFEGYAWDLNGNGRRDLDGSEYSMAPSELAFPRFIGEDAQRSSELVLIDLTGGAGWSSIVDLLLYNDNEELFTAEHEFSCWTRVKLTNVAGFFNESFLVNFTNHDPSEPHFLPGLETGWFSVQGLVASNAFSVVTSPAVLGFLVERSSLAGESADLPFGIGANGNGHLPGLGNTALMGSGAMKPSISPGKR